jgi:hypothetical protein
MKIITGIIANNSGTNIANAAPSFLMSGVYLG